jgi:hypothetical protein
MSGGAARGTKAANDGFVIERCGLLICLKVDESLPISSVPAATLKQIKPLK